jgi:hypothetical protein
MNREESWHLHSVMQSTYRSVVFLVRRGRQKREAGREALNTRSE